jgi:endonuclease G
MVDLAQLSATEARYRERTEARDDVRRSVSEGRLLDVDEPERIAKRMARLAPAAAVVSPIASPAAALGADVLVLKRLIDTNDLIGAGFLAKGASAVRSIARIVIRAGPELVEGFGPGFLVAPGLLMTNNHVLPDAAGAVHSQAEFDHQLGPGGALGPSAAFALEPGVFFVTDQALDFTVVAVASNGGGRSLAEFGWNPLIELEGKVILHELLNIVQHPNGEPKQLALRENRLVDLVEDFLHYETDTAPGSSGSPVFNDQWEVVGLNHSGVPRRDSQGAILARSGEPWTPAMGEGAIDWVANEGVRVSRICRRLRSLSLSGSQAELRDQLLTAAAPPQTVAPAAPPSARSVAVSPESASTAAQVTMTVPVEITVRIGSSALPPPPLPPAVAASSPPQQSQEVREALVRLSEARRVPYYDEAADSEVRTAYYAGIGADASGEALFQALAQLVSTTHRTTPRYKPNVELYPDVDLQPDGQLLSIYTGQTFAPERLIVEDARIEQRRLQARELRLVEAATTPEALAALEEELEAALPFNCEHVVPQSWFDKAEPMRGDLTTCSPARWSATASAATRRSSISPTSARRSESTAASERSTASSRTQERGRPPVRPFTSSSATPGLSTALHESSSKTGWRSCSPGTTPFRPRSMSATATPASTLARGTAIPSSTTLIGPPRLISPWASVERAPRQATPGNRQKSRRCITPAGVPRRRRPSGRIQGRGAVIRPLPFAPQVDPCLAQLAD